MIEGMALGPTGALICMIRILAGHARNRPKTSMGGFQVKGEGQLLGTNFVHKEEGEERGGGTCLYAQRPKHSHQRRAHPQCTDIHRKGHVRQRLNPARGEAGGGRNDLRRCSTTAAERYTGISGWLARKKSKRRTTTSRCCIAHMQGKSFMVM